MASAANANPLNHFAETLKTRYFSDNFWGHCSQAVTVVFIAFLAVSVESKTWSLGMTALRYKYVLYF